MTYSPALIVHIAGGIVGVLSGFTALLARKGSRLHRKSGDVFVVSMMTMAAAGAYVAFRKSQPPNMIAGAFTFYLVASAWLTVKRKDNETSRVDFALLLVGSAAAIISLIFGLEAARSTDSSAGAMVGPYFAFGTVAVLATIGDIRMLYRGGVSGAKRLVRHLWRMCIALFIATASFFLGSSNDPVLRRTGLRATLFTAAIRRTHLPELPVLIVVILTIFWLFRVWFSKAYKNQRLGATDDIGTRPPRNASMGQMPLRSWTASDR